MVRISDGRMSGTGYGTVILHVSPETADNGPIGLVEDGDFIELNIPNRSLTLCITDEEMALRKAKRTPFVPATPRGYVNLFVNHVEQAHLGADLDFLKGKSGSKVLRDSH